MQKHLGRNLTKHPTDKSNFFSGVWFKAAFFLFLTILTFLAYRPILNNALVCDDYYLLGQDKLHLFGYQSLGELSNYQWVFKAMSPFFLRPLVLSIWLVTSDFFGPSSWPYHATNVLLHAANSWLLFYLLTKLKASRAVAVLSALLFALTPIAPEAVTWSSGSFDLFSFFFILLSSCFYATYLEQGKRRYYFFSLSIMVLALLSKEMALTMILIVIVMELLFRNTLGLENTHFSENWKRNIRRTTVTVIPFIVVYIGYFTLRFIILGSLFQKETTSPFSSGFDPFSTMFVFLSPLSNFYFGSKFIMFACIYISGLFAIAQIFVLTNWRNTSTAKRRLWIFSLSLFAISLMPVGPPLLAGLHNDLARSRFLYMATAFFLALLPISLLEFSPKKSWFITGIVSLSLLIPIYFWGLQENNHYWENSAAVDRYILSEVQRLLPNPPTGAKIYLFKEGESPESRIYWCSPMLQPAVRTSYERYDLQVVQTNSEANQQSWSSPNSAVNSFSDSLALSNRF